MPVTFTCSIDDGHPSDLKMAELLDKHALTGTFFVPIQNCEGRSVMPPELIRILGQQFEIGSHTLTHRYLSSVDIAQAKFEILQGKAALEHILGRSVTGFCYPGGKFRKEHADLVKSGGFHYARTTMNLCFDAGPNRFEMATTCQFYPHPRSVYVRNFTKGGYWSMRHSGLLLTLGRSDWIARMYDLFDHACEKGAIFHLWCHSEDIDTFNAWRELDDFLAHTGACVANFNRVSNEQLARRFFPALSENEQI